MPIYCIAFLVRCQALVLSLLGAIPFKWLDICVSQLFLLKPGYILIHFSKAIHDQGQVYFAEVTIRAPFLQVRPRQLLILFTLKPTMPPSLRSAVPVLDQRLSL